MILAGDIGGTKCTLTLFDCAGGQLKPLLRSSSPTHEVASMEALLDNFRIQAQPKGLHLNGQLRAAGFGVAGTIVDGRTVSNNLPWIVESNSVASALGLGPERMLLLNDLVAAASSLAHLQPSDLLQLNEGSSEPRAPKALIAAGTGLGEAILFWDG